MKTQFVTLVAVALSGPVNAQRAITTDSGNAAPATGRCSVSKQGAMIVADFDFDSVSQPIKISVGASSDRIVPPVTWHAINTKGTGGNREITPPSTCDSSGSSSPTDHAVYEGAGANDRNHDPHSYIGAGAGRHKDMIDVVLITTTCAISGGPASPVVSVHMTVPASSKATFKELSFTRSTAPGPGGGPNVKRNAIVCAATDGAPSDISMLLLPAVQK